MQTSAKPRIPAVLLVLIASCPSCAPTICERSLCNSTFSPPIRIFDARLSASSMVLSPVITARPSVIAACTLGTEMNLPS